MMPKKRLLISFILVMLISACSLPGGMPTSPPVQPAAVQSQNSSDYFPLKKGAYWVYQGTVGGLKLVLRMCSKKKLHGRWKLCKSFIGMIYWL
jgi:hypothetical protein